MRSGLHLCRERLERIQSIIAQSAGGRIAARELMRRFGIHQFEVDAAEAGGWIRFETRKPRTGRPSVECVAAEPAKGNKTAPAKLPPRRADLPLALNWDEERFLNLYHVRGGSGFFGGGRGTNSAAWAYRRTYGTRRRLRANSARSAAGRLARQPWIDTAWRLGKRLMFVRPVPAPPADMRSHWQEWKMIMILIHRLNGFDWQADIKQTVGASRTAQAAAAALLPHPRLADDDAQTVLNYIADGERVQIHSK